jgi:hypothetical protein
MMPLESSASEATIWSINLESSIMIFEVSFTLIYDVYSTGITCEDGQLMFIVQATGVIRTECAAPLS